MSDIDIGRYTLFLLYIIIILDVAQSFYISIFLNLIFYFFYFLNLQFCDSEDEKVNRLYFNSNNTHTKFNNFV